MATTSQHGMETGNKACPLVSEDDDARGAPVDALLLLASREASWLVRPWKPTMMCDELMMMNHDVLQLARTTMASAGLARATSYQPNSS